MKRFHSSRRLPNRCRASPPPSPSLALVVAGLQRASVAQAEAAISLDAPVSFPADI